MRTVRQRLLLHPCMQAPNDGNWAEVSLRLIHSTRAGFGSLQCRVTSIVRRPGPTFTDSHYTLPRPGRHRAVSFPPCAGRVSHSCFTGPFTRQCLRKMSADIVFLINFLCVYPNTSNESYHKVQGTCVHIQRRELIRMCSHSNKFSSPILRLRFPPHYSLTLTTLRLHGECIHVTTCRMRSGWNLIK